MLFVLGCFITLSLVLESNMFSVQIVGWFSLLSDQCSWGFCVSFQCIIRDSLWLSISLICVCFMILKSSWVKFGSFTSFRLQSALNLILVVCNIIFGETWILKNVLLKLNLRWTFKIHVVKKCLKRFFESARQFFRAQFSIWKYVWNSWVLRAYHSNISWLSYTLQVYAWKFFNTLYYFPVFPYKLSITFYIIIIIIIIIIFNIKVKFSVLLIASCLVLFTFFF